MLKLQRDKKYIIAHSREVQAKLAERRVKLREIVSQEYNEALYNELVRRGREHDLSYTQLLISRCASLEARKKKTLDAQILHSHVV